MRKRKRKGGGGKGAESPVARRRRPRRVKAAVVAALALCVVAAGAASLRWGLARRAAAPAPALEPAARQPLQPSKEYIYAGGRLVATEEPLSRPYPNGIPHAVPGTIQAEDYDNGGQGLAYNDTEPSENVMGAYRPSPSGVDLEACGDSGGGYNVGWTWGGEWTEYTISVASSGAYDIEVRVASGNGGGGTFHLAVNGAGVTGPLAVPNTGGWQSYQSVTKPGVSLTAGVHVMRLSLDSEGPQGGVANFNYVRITSAASGPAPTDLVATATSATRVELTWAPPSGSASGYVVERAQSKDAFENISSPTEARFVDTGAEPDRAYLYRVKAVYAGGGHSGYSNSDLATTVIFGEALVPRVTTIKAVHLVELRRAVEAVRALVPGLGAPAWAYLNPVSTPPGQRRRIYLEDVTDLRSNLDAALSGLGRYEPYPAEPVLARGAVVYAAHFEQIRQRVR